jgi:hypothetical protein
MLFRDSIFEDVFSSADSAAITLEKGAALYCHNCTFFHLQSQAYKSTLISNSTRNQHFSKDERRQVMLRDVSMNEDSRVSKVIVDTNRNFTLAQVLHDLWEINDD